MMVRKVKVEISKYDQLTRLLIITKSLKASTMNNMMDEKFVVSGMVIEAISDSKNY